MNLYKIAEYVCWITALISAFAAMILPVGLDKHAFLPFFLSLLGITFFSRKASKGAIYDERILRITARSNTFGMGITGGYCGILAFAAKIFGFEWLNVPFAVATVFIVMVLSSRIIFEILIRMPGAEGK